MACSSFRLLRRVGKCASLAVADTVVFVPAVQARCPAGCAASLVTDGMPSFGPRDENPAEDSIHARLEADGRVGLFIENGRYDVLLTSEETLVDGRWYHLAASWSPNTTDLYLDGRRVAWEREGRELLQGTLPELRVGSGPLDSGRASFTGDIDEFAAWDRALTEIEVGQQYPSSREGGSKSAR